MKKLGRQGFTLIEVIVVAAIIAILAGILVPMIFNQIDESKVARATGEAKSIQTALIAFRKDTGNWPYYSSAASLAANNPDIDILVTKNAEDIPQADKDTLTAMGYSVNKLVNINDLLNDTVKAKAIYGDKWKGPYLSQVTTDPWDKSYIIPIGKLSPTVTPGPVMIFSAGKTGGYETDAGATGVSGDDIGVRIQ